LIVFGDMEDHPEGRAAAGPQSALPNAANVLRAAGDNEE
jgi:hypothetical protein